MTKKPVTESEMIKAMEIIHKRKISAIFPTVKGSSVVKQYLEAVGFKL